MKIVPGLALLVLSFTLAACASTPPLTLRSTGFEDISVPQSFRYQAARSIIIESPNVKAARLLYGGRIDPEVVSVTLRGSLERSGWRHINTTRGRSITQVYEKGGDALQIAIWEGSLFNRFTYLELTASRAFLLPPVGTRSDFVPETE
jgi:hypothetical protein